MTGGHWLNIGPLSEAEFETVLQKKIGDGFVGNRNFTEWFRDQMLQWKRVPSDAENRARETGASMLHLWCANIADNLENIRNGYTIRDLVPVTPVTKPVVIIGGGPSLLRKNHPKLLAEYRDKVTLVSTDSALRHLIKEDVTPDYVVTIDGNRELLKKFYEINELPMDFNSRNMKIVFGCSTAKATYEVAEKLGPVYWFLPMWDNASLPDSIVRVLTFMTQSERNHNGAPTLRAGSNCGMTCISLAFAILQYKQIILTGMDMGYPGDWPYEETAYYLNAKMQGVKMETFQRIMTRFTHPLWGEAYVDSVFLQYRKSLLDMASELPEDVKLINCTEGGTVWGRNITCMNLKECLEALP